MRTRNKLIATFGIVSMLGLGGAALARPPGGPGGDVSYLTLRYIENCGHLSLPIAGTGIRGREGSV